MIITLHQPDTHVHVVWHVPCCHSCHTLIADDHVFLPIYLIFALKKKTPKKQLDERAFIMPSEAHFACESCRWPCQVVSSYHRLTSLMTIVCHANAAAASPVNAAEIALFLIYCGRGKTWIHDAIKTKSCCTIPANGPCCWTSTDLRAPARATTAGFTLQASMPNSNLLLPPACI